MCSFIIIRTYVVAQYSTMYVAYFVKDLLQRKYVQHVRGQVTELFPQPILINICTTKKVK
jgi:hypothetical protein